MNVDSLGYQYYVNSMAPIINSYLGDKWNLVNTSSPSYYTRIEFDESEGKFKKVTKVEYIYDQESINTLSDYYSQYLSNVNANSNIYSNLTVYRTSSDSTK
jgi:hypothetical protein